MTTMSTSIRKTTVMMTTIIKQMPILNDVEDDGNDYDHYGDHNDDDNDYDNTDDDLNDVDDDHNDYECNGDHSDDDANDTGR